MRLFIRGIVATGLLSLGYVLGATGIPGLPLAQAQPNQSRPQELSEQTAKEIQQAHEALRSAMRSLKEAGQYNAATQGVNAFAVLCGGVDAMEDLEAGRGVDPETFAALYAGRAIDKVKDHLGRDEQNRLTYKNELVRMYPISHLKRLFAKRAKLAGIASEESSSSPSISK